jgi:hypothetical protein
MCGVWLRQVDAGCSEAANRHGNRSSTPVDRMVCDVRENMTRIPSTGDAIAGAKNYIMMAQRRDAGLAIRQ